MSTFAFVFLCIQACLVQHVFSQCTSPASVVDVPFGLAAPGLAARGLAGPMGWSGPGFATNGLVAPGIATPFGLASPFAYDGLAYPGVAPYGGAGEGNVAVAGELPVAGTTAVGGQVPIMGAVSFGGVVPAAGAVNINGQCACGCNAPIYY
ncbi:chorion class A protein Ld19-like isoform X2 [Spodoptera litura]|uniref:Chorion class A protein Ld19-like isoform X2 n=1 Tax=Spodoptera litura TaxID=69820 RepID=A0A9J7DR76_SPOLT|nr:chorion class A protein Ld19-like isoform X2 [Spodoptera litura]